MLYYIMGVVLDKQQLLSSTLVTSCLGRPVAPVTVKTVGSWSGGVVHSGVWCLRVRYEIRYGVHVAEERCWSGVSRWDWMVDSEEGQQR